MSKLEEAERLAWADLQTANKEHDDAYKGVSIDCSTPAMGKRIDSVCKCVDALSAWTTAHDELNKERYGR